MRTPHNAQRIFFDPFLQGMVWLIIGLTASNPNVCADQYVNNHPPPDVCKLDADGLFNYAEHFFALEDYEEAISAYKRFGYFFPGDNRNFLVVFKLGRCYYFKKQFKESIHFFQKVIDADNHSELAIKSYYLISDCHVGLYEFGPAVNTLHNLISSTEESAVIDAAYFKIGWIYLDKIHLTDLSINSNALTKAHASFEKIKDKERYDVHRLLSNMERRLGKQEKSPALAGTLSVFPGLGYIYCGRYKDAVIALIMAGGLSYAAFEACDHEQYALGVFLGAAGLGFYGGSIYGSVTSAYKINRYYDHQYIEEMRSVPDREAYEKDNAGSVGLVFNTKF